MRTRRLLHALVIPVVLAGLAGCGSDDASTASDPASSDAATESPSSTPSTSQAATADPSSSAAPDMPDCEEVWEDGATLPGGYLGCQDGETRVKAERRYCEFGKPLVTYADRFYAVPGGRIAEGSTPLQQDAGYRDVLRSCSG